MSKYSPRPVEDSETLARFIFSPIHVSKKGDLKPSVFSHVSTVGCSIQRDGIAKDGEVLSFVTNFLANRDDFAWWGVLTGQCKVVRNILAGETDNRGVCVFDTSEPENPAHAELCQTHYVVDEADKVELRRNLFFAFGNGVCIPPVQYRLGKTWDALPINFRSRPTNPAR